MLIIQRYNARADSPLPLKTLILASTFILGPRQQDSAAFNEGELVIESRALLPNLTSSES